MAREAAPDEVAPVLVTQAEMQLKNGQPPKWLVPMTLPKGSPFMLFKRVD